MKRDFRPVLTTIVFGIGAAICFYPLSALVHHLAPWYRAVMITFGIYLVLYALLLARWVRQGAQTSVLAIVSTMFAALFLPSLNMSLGAMLLILGWIRSRQCFRLPFLWMVVGEIIIGCGGLMLVSALHPSSMVEWSLGIWLFFLIQSLYFIMFADKSMTIKKNESPDPFETARGRAEEIIEATIG